MVALIYWERQDSDRMCALHCLNSLLQGPYYEAAELASVAEQLDRREGEIMGGIAEESHNVSDDGYFSVSVIEECLQKWGLLCIPAKRPELAESFANPTLEEAFLCNLSGHWFAVRKLFGKWYNLDSLKAAPRVISEFYLSAFMRGLLDQGYSLFAVRPQSVPPLHVGGDDSGVPPIAPIVLPQLNNQRLNPNQFFLNENQISDMLATAERREAEELENAQKIVDMNEEALDRNNDADGARSFIFPKNEARPVDWPEDSRGRLLVEPVPAVDALVSSSADQDDPELATALRLSLQALHSSLPTPPAEPPQTSPHFVVQIRFPDGSRRARRFSPDNFILHLFMWLEVEGSILEDGNSKLDPPLAVRNQYSLRSSYPRISFVKSHEGKIQIVGEKGVGEEGGSVSLKDAGLDGDVSFHLQLF